MLHYSVAATFDSIRHMVDEKNLSRRDVIDYLDRLADTILEFDSASFDYYYDKYGKKHDEILFKKKFSDEILVSFDLVSNKKRSLTLQTLYMEGGDYIKKKAAKALLMQNSLSRTPEVRVGQPSDYRISQKTNSVNSKNQNSKKIFSTDYYIDDFTNEVELIYVLKSINKKESAVLNAPRSAVKLLSYTDSTISIAQLLEYVNENCPNVFRNLY